MSPCEEVNSRDVKSIILTRLSVKLEIQMPDDECFRFDSYSEPAFLACSDHRTLVLGFASNCFRLVNWKEQGKRRRRSFGVTPMRPNILSSTIQESLVHLTKARQVGVFELRY